jgi:hypothetical protein
MYRLCFLLHEFLTPVTIHPLLLLIPIKCLSHLKWIIRIQSEEAANVFTDYFLNIADNLQPHIDNIISPFRLLKYACKTVFVRMKIIPVTKGEIISIICSLKSMNSSGYDGISSNMLKLCSMAISELFLHLQHVYYDWCIP